MLRAYFGEPEGEKCGLCDSCAGLDSEVFDPGAADQRTGLHAATDFHARPRRRRRGRGGMEMPAAQPTPAAARAPVFETAIPAEIPPPLPPWELPAPADNEREIDGSVWASAPEAAQPMAGDPLHDDADAWLAEIMAAPPPEVPAPVNGVEVLAASAPDGASGAPPEGAPDASSGDPYLPAWSAVRDANIRPYADWRPAPNVSLPVMQVRQQPQHQNGHGGQQGQQGRPHQQGQQGQHGRNSGNGHKGGDDRGGRRRRRRGQRNNDRQNRNRDRGPRLPGFYNPGGD
jgi:hypothetical protein